MTATFSRRRRRTAAAACLCLLAATGSRVGAADKWIEARSAHFTVTSNASQGEATALAWQLEQIRGAIATIYPWSKVDLSRPLAIFAMKDETSLKALAPEFWENKRGGAASVWVSGPEQHYLAVRTDVLADSQGDVNPFHSSYFSYVSLILQQSLERPLPEWFMRGLAGVWSNTVIRQSKILLGLPIPWHIQRLRDQPRLHLADVIGTTRGSPLLRNADALSQFDAEAWALVHFLMFADGGARWGKLDQYVKAVFAGADPQVAFREVIGSPDELETPFRIYLSRALFSARQINVDVSVKREGFTVTSLAPAESASRRALFHTAMRRPVEARAAIAEARKAGDAPDSFTAEALLLEREGKTEEAKAAYERAAAAGTTIEYAYYRLGSMLWQPDSSPETLQRVEDLFAEAIKRNTRDAWAYASIGEVRSVRGSPGDPMGMVRRALSLEPGEAHHHLRAASVLWRQKKYDEALVQAQAARELATDDQVRQHAADMIEGISRARR
jgi:tetratricopeptide (TPR) repeat protein